MRLCWFFKELVHFCARAMLCEISLFVTFLCWSPVAKHPGLASLYSYCFWTAEQHTTTREMLPYGSLLSVHSFTPNLTTWSLLVMDEVSLNSVILYPFSSPVQSSLPSAMCLRNEVSSTELTTAMHCKNSIQHSLNRCITTCCFYASSRSFLHFNT